MEKGVVISRGQDIDHQKEESIFSSFEKGSLLGSNYTFFTTLQIELSHSHVPPKTS